MTLYDKLGELNNSDMLPMHMPGHKRSSKAGRMSEIWSMDITEIEGFDNLHAPSGIIKTMQDDIARLYGAKSAYLSVNGSTAANEAAILSACHNGDSIIMSRASHKSVYYAVQLGRLIPIYIEHKYYGSTSITDVADAREISKLLDMNPQCHCVCITSPTYEGLFADIEHIAKVVHEHDAVLIVDCAHGAHLGFSELLPDNPITLGADMVIMSLHKTLPSPTQTSVLLCSDTERIDTSRVSHYMKVFQSTSPSYILMAGVGECIEYLKTDMSDDISRLCSEISRFQDAVSGCRYIDTYPVPGNDPTKIIIKVRTGNMDGSALNNLLRNKYHIECEMSSDDYCLALLSVMDDATSLGRLSEAIISIDSMMATNICVDEDSRRAHADSEKISVGMPRPFVKYIAADALDMPYERLPFDSRVSNRISASYVYQYPPGIPTLVPGEIITDEIIEYINKGIKMGLNILGLDNGEISVIR